MSTQFVDALFVIPFHEVPKSFLWKHLVEIFMVVSKIPKFLEIVFDFYSSHWARNECSETSYIILSSFKTFLWYKIFIIIQTKKCHVTLLKQNWTFSAFFSKRLSDVHAKKNSFCGIFQTSATHHFSTITVSSPYLVDKSISNG